MQGTELGRHEFRNVLREIVGVSGPNIALTTRSADARELAAELARAEQPLVRTLTHEELGQRDADAGGSLATDNGESG
jgi:hypothetical protein